MRAPGSRLIIGLPQLLLGWGLWATTNGQCELRLPAYYVHLIVPTEFRFAASMQKYAGTPAVSVGVVAEIMIVAALCVFLKGKETGFERYVCPSSLTMPVADFRRLAQRRLSG